MSSATTPSPWNRDLMLAVACAALIVTVSMGIRQSFGLFMPEMGRDFGIGREWFGLAIAVQNLLFGLVQPWVGAASDKYGARRVVLVGALIYAAGLVLAATAQGSASMMMALGVLVGLGLSGTTFVVLMGSVARWVQPDQRSRALGLVTAGGSLGQFAVVPMSQWWIDLFGWRGAMVGMLVLMALLVLAILGLKRDAAPPEAASKAEGLAAALRSAARHPHYWLLNGGFFVCGFHIAFVATHFPAYLIDQGIPASVGAGCLALIGLFNIAGSYLFGIWGDRRSRTWLLGCLYGSRAVAIAVFLLVPLSPLSALLFAAVFGFLWLGTVPLTSGAVASMFGLRHMSALYGVVFLSHQVGSFLGAWWAGRLYDQTGSYQAVWLTSIALGVIAALLSFATRDHAVEAKPAVAAA